MAWARPSSTGDWSVISTNESYRSIAIRRGSREPEDVTVVRSGPDTRRMRPIHPPATARAGAPHLLAYLGIMGPQDGIDVVVDVRAELVHRRGRTDVHAVLMGFGDCLEDLKAQSTRLHLDDHIRFTGRVFSDTIAEYLSAADVGLCPDRKTPLNDVSTMNKTMEYMSYCLPSVSFDLVETRVSAGDTAVFVPSGDIAAFADAVEHLLDDADTRVAMGLAARARVVSELDWRPQARAYVGVYDRLLLGADAPDRSQDADDAGPEPITDEAGRSYVALDDPAALAEFVRTRGAPAPPPEPQ
jgi:glycosyltransferase involved in cell wall biosynthesis